MNFENIPKHLFDIIADKKYVDLTFEEKEMVNQYMDHKEYNSIHHAINDFQELDNELKISNPRLKRVKNKAPLLVKIINYKVPVYMIASSIALLFCVNFLLSTDQNAQKITPAEKTLQTSKEGIPLHKDQYPVDLVFEM